MQNFVILHRHAICDALGRNTGAGDRPVWHILHAALRIVPFFWSCVLWPQTSQIQGLRLRSRSWARSREPVLGAGAGERRGRQGNRGGPPGRRWRPQRPDHQCLGCTSFPSVCALRLEELLSNLGHRMYHCFAATPPNPRTPQHPNLQRCMESCMQSALVFSCATACITTLLHCGLATPLKSPKF